MTLHPHAIPPVPALTADAVHAAFPKGNLYVDLRAEFGTLYDDQLFVDLYPPQGRPVTVAPWRLALVLVMQYMEGLTDRQAADAVRRCMDWKYVLSLDLTDPGFDFTLLHDFRQRLLVNTAAQRLLDQFLIACKACGLIKPRGSQRTDSTHVLAAVRTLHRLECVLETMHLALTQLAQADPHWVHQWIPPAWYDSYGLRAERARLPKEASKREALAARIGTDGHHLIRMLFASDTPPALRGLPAIEILRQIWIQQFYCWMTEQGEQIRWRTIHEEPPTAQLIQSPYDLEARYGSKRDTHWVGYKVHLTETCDAGRPDVVTSVITTTATIQDSDIGPVVQQDLANRGLCRAYISSTLATLTHTCS